MLALRFTSTDNEEGFTSEDQVNKIQFNGLCCYDITDAVSELIDDDYYDYTDALEICARLQAENDNWHACNSKGKYVVFEGIFTEFDRDNQDRFGNRAVIAKFKNYEAHGIINQEQIGWSNVSIKLD